MFETAYERNFKGNPTDLFDTQDNVTNGKGSMRFAIKKLEMNFGQLYTTTPSLSSPEDLGTKFRNVWALYNRIPSYPLQVFRRAAQYLPTGGPVFHQ